MATANEVEHNRKNQTWRSSLAPLRDALLNGSQALHS